VSIEDSYKNKLLDMLLAIDDVCKKNNIQYWLDGGTLLGAYRHGGFIPWDDDIDIGVMRTDYPKLKQALSLELPSQFFLQTDDSEFNYNHAFIKVRDTQTSSSAKLDSTYDQRGLFIDIFPFDFVPKSHALRVLHYAISKMRLFLVVYEKESVIDFSDESIVADRGDESSDQYINKKSNNFFTHLFYLLLNWVPKRFWSWLLFATRKTVMNKKHIGDGYCFPTFFFRSIREYDVYFPLTEIQFEGKTFKAPHNIPRYLTSLYGADYMTPRQDLHTQHMESLQNIDGPVA